jgi:hypothetical protein
VIVAEEAADKAKWAEEEEISDRLAASHRPVVVASRGVKGRPRVEYLANGSMQINY